LKYTDTGQVTRQSWKRNYLCVWRKTDFPPPRRVTRLGNSALMSILFVIEMLNSNYECAQGDTCLRVAASAKAGAAIPHAGWVHEYLTLEVKYQTNCSTLLCFD
jgi:hypothetical protein